MRTTIYIKFWITILILSGMSLHTIAQQGYRIDFNLTNYSSDEMLLVYYLGDKQYIKDTLHANSPGQFTAQGNENLDPGMYIAYFPSQNTSFDFLVDSNDQHFQLSTNLQDIATEMHVEGSQENTLFFNYLKYLEEKRNESTVLSKSLENLKKDPENNKNKISTLEEILAGLDQEVNTYQKDIIQKHPDSFTADIIKINAPIEIPEEFRKGDDDGFYYYREHFFDHVNFAKERILQTPFYIQKADQYVGNQLTTQIPDSVIVAVDRLLRLAETNEVVYKHTLIRLLNKYAQSNLVCFDAVYVHIVDEYYAKGKAPWLDADQRTKILKDANALRPILCGKKAPDFELQSINNPEETIQLHSLNAEYTVLFFWSPDYPDEISSLKSFYDEYKNNGVKILSICIDSDYSTNSCRAFIAKNEIQPWINGVDSEGLSDIKDTYNIHSSTKIFFLDKNKEIIAKEMEAQHLGAILQNTLHPDKE